MTYSAFLAIFLPTTAMVVLGVTLMLSRFSHERAM